MLEGFAELGVALLGPFLDPLSRTYWLGLLVTMVISACFYWLKRPPSWSLSGVASVLTHRSTGLDLQLMVGRQLLRLLTGAPALTSGWLVATRGVRWMDQTLGVPELPQYPSVLLTLVYSLVLFIAWDLSRFVLHWMMHNVPFLWSFHQIHHSAEVITPITHYRIHPVESWLYDLRGAIVTGAVAGAFYWLFRENVSHWTLLGVPAFGFVCNVTTGNLRHSHVWLRFPAWIERWLISPAQHQVHHSLNPAHFGSNYGTWLAIWDRAAGTLVLSMSVAPVEYGIPSDERNHGDDLLSAWFGPFRDLIWRYGPSAGLVIMVLFASARAFANDEEEPADWSGFGEEIIVDGDQQKPREAGSAHIVDESELELFEYDDVERVLLQVPGVSTRGEDGFGLRPNIGIRGANSDRSAKVTLMEDGVLLAPAPYAAPAAYYFPMSTRFTGLEVFKGAASTRYGPNTVGGAINVITREIPDSFAAYSDVSLGLRRSYKAHAWTGLQAEKVGFLVEGVHLQSDGFRELDGGGPTGFDRTEFMVKSRLDAGKNRLQLKLGYARENSFETYLGLSSGDVESTPMRRYSASQMGFMTWDRTQAVLEWRARPSDSVKIRTVAYHHWLDRSWTKLNGFSGGQDLQDLLYSDPDSGQGAVYMAVLRGEENSDSLGESLMVGTNERAYHSFGVQSTFRWEEYGNYLSSAFEAGLRLHGDDVRRLHTEEAHEMVDGVMATSGLPFDTLLESHSGVTALAAYAHEDLSMGKVHVFPSARVEVVRGWREDQGVESPPPLTRAALLPGFGALYAFDDWTDLFASVHRGFSPVAPGQPAEVLPEYSWNYEVGLRRNVGVFRGEVVGFWNDYSNITGQCTLSSGCDDSNLDRQFNGGRAQIVGVESLTALQLPLSRSVSLPFSLTYTLTEARFLTDFYSSFAQFGSVSRGDSLPYVARHQGRVHTGVETERARFGLGLSYRGKMMDRASILGASDEITIPELVLVDLGANYQLSGQWQAYLSGTNLLNADQPVSWRPFGARTAAPLQVMTGLKWRG